MAFSVSSNLTTATVKTCTSCKQPKELGEFNKRAASLDGLNWYCRVCANAKRMVRYHDKIDEERAQNRKWYTDHKPWKDPDKRKYHNAWRRGHSRVVEVNNRRAKLRDGGEFTTDEWGALCDSYDNKCLRCGNEKISVDHVVPVSKGGRNTIDNLQPLCMRCNMWKGTRTIDFRS